MFLIVLEILQGQSAGRAARRHYLQVERFPPTAGAYAAVLMTRHRN